MPNIVWEVVKQKLTERKPIDALRVWLVEEEGYRLTRYLDSLGFGTIGIGHLIKPGEMWERCSPAEALALLEKDIDEAVYGFTVLFASDLVRIDEARQMALVAMIFQMGEDGVRRFPAMRRAISDGNWAEAAKEALDSEWARTQAPPRAARTAEILRRGIEGLPGRKA